MALSSTSGTGLDINSIVSQLMQVEQQPLTALAKKEASYQAKLTAYGSLKSALGSFQSALTSLNNPAKFQSFSSSSSDATVATAAASSSASAGSYTLNVTQLAQAQTLSSAGQASTTASIGDGSLTTITFQFGTITGGTLASGAYTGATFSQDAEQSTGTVTIDSSNNSLQGIRDAINKANIGVTATIVSDGSANPHHLVLTSKETGATSSMKISVNGNADIASLIANDPEDVQNMTQTSVAQSAAITLNGIGITSKKNTVSDAVQGLTLNLLKAGTSTVSVTRDVAAVKSAVNNFVKAYNDANKTIKNLTAYNTETKTAATLTGDATARTIETGLRQMLGGAITESAGKLKTLSDIGVAFQKDGTLAVDTTKLDKAMSSNFEDVGALFAAMGSATDSLVSYTGSSTATTEGRYAVSVTTPARQASLTGDKDLTAATTTIPSGASLSVTLDGTTASVDLSGGTYTASQLASMLQSAINGTSAFSSAGATVKASINTGGTLSLTSNRYGSESAVTVASGTGMSVTDLFGTSLVAVTGRDVAGTIGGALASGSGQILTGGDGSPAAGLKLTISGDATGNRGTVSFSRGYAWRLNELVNGYLGSDGLISGRTEGLSSSIKDIGKSRDALTTRLENIEARYRAQFVALDSALSSMNTTSSYLTQQLASIANNS